MKLLDDIRAKLGDAAGVLSEELASIEGKLKNTRSQLEADFDAEVAKGSEELKAKWAKLRALL